MSAELKAMMDEQKQVWSNLQTAFAKMDTEIKSIGTSMPETKSLIEKLNGRIDELETKLSRPGFLLAEKDKEQKQVPAELSAFEKVIRFGMKDGKALARMTAEEKAAWQASETKTMTSGVDTSLGFFAPEDFRAEIIRKLPNYAGVGALVTRQATSRDTLRYPQITYTTDDIKTSGVTVTWEDENDTATETSFAVGSLAVPVKKARAIIRVSNELLEDSAVDILALLTELFAEAFAVEEDRVFTVGTGVKQPLGFMNGTITVINSGAAGAFTYDGIVDLVYGLPEQYAANAQFMCRRASIGAIRKLKDTTNQPLWQPALSAGQPATLMGYGIRTNEHMPALGANAKALAFADFRRLYLAADRVGMTVKRLDEKYADTDETGFIVRRRLGGRPIQPWAARIQQLT